MHTVSLSLSVMVTAVVVVIDVVLIVVVIWVIVVVVTVVKIPADPAQESGEVILPGSADTRREHFYSCKLNCLC